jgi:hypothetical protein
MLDLQPPRHTSTLHLADKRVPTGREINVFVSKALADVHREMAAFYRRTALPEIKSRTNRPLFHAGSRAVPSSNDRSV